ncbi:hypothetical protein VTK26DRAFT_1936 [Humicola hyalothermophila]
MRAMRYNCKLHMVQDLVPGFIPSNESTVRSSQHKLESSELYLSSIHHHQSVPQSMAIGHKTAIHGVIKWRDQDTFSFRHGHPSELGNYSEFRQGIESMTKRNKE